MSTDKPEKCYREPKLTIAETEFLENVTALAIGIIRNMEDFAAYIEDREQLDIALEIQREAQTIRLMTIAEKKRRKDEKRNGSS